MGIYRGLLFVNSCPESMVRRPSWIASGCGRYMELVTEETPSPVCTPSLGYISIAFNKRPLRYKNYGKVGLMVTYGTLYLSIIKWGRDCLF